MSNGDYLFYFWISGILGSGRWSLPMWPTPDKNPDGKYFTLSQLITGELCPVWLYWERTLRSLCLVSAHVPILLADFAWYPFTIIHPSCAYNDICWVYHAPRKLPSRRVILETPKTMSIITNVKLLLYEVVFKNQIGENEL